LQITSRYFGFDDSTAMMLPIFDLANHYDGCQNIMAWNPDKSVSIVAGHDIKAGEEVGAVYETD
jgi:hypothetical protein